MINETRGPSGLPPQTQVPDSIEVIKQRIENLGTLRNKTAIPELEKFLTHKNPLVVIDAAIALYKLDAPGQAKLTLEQFLTGNPDLNHIKYFLVKLETLHQPQVRANQDVVKFPHHSNQGTRRSYYPGEIVD